MSEQNERKRQRRSKARNEEDETAGGLGPKSNTDPVTMADAGLPRSGSATTTPATSGTETVPAEEQRVGQVNHEVGE